MRVMFEVMSAFDQGEKFTSVQKWELVGLPVLRDGLLRPSNLCVFTSFVHNYPMTDIVGQNYLRRDNLARCQCLCATGLITAFANLLGIHAISN